VVDRQITSLSIRQTTFPGKVHLYVLHCKYASSFCCPKCISLCTPGRLAREKASHENRDTINSKYLVTSGSPYVQQRIDAERNNNTGLIYLFIYFLKENGL